MVYENIKESLRSLYGSLIENKVGCATVKTQTNIKIGLAETTTTFNAELHVIEVVLN
jgi:hypothetical protein